MSAEAAATGGDNGGGGDGGGAEIPVDAIESGDVPPANGVGDAPAKGGAKPKARAADAGDLFDLEGHADRRVEIKINGKTERVPLRELARSYESKGGRHKLLEEVRTRAKQLEADWAEIQKDPGAALLKRGDAHVESVLERLLTSDDPKLKGRVESVLKRLTEEAQMGPEERRLREIDRRERELEERLKREETERQERIQQAEAERFRTAYDRAFRSQLEAAGLPVTNETVIEVASVMEALLEAGADPRAVATVQQAVDIAQEELHRRWDRSLSRLTKPEQVAKALGEERLRALREWDIARVRGGGGAAPKPAAGAPTTPKGAPKSTAISADEIRRKYGF